MLPARPFACSSYAARGVHAEADFLSVSALCRTGASSERGAQRSDSLPVRVLWRRGRVHELPQITAQASMGRWLPLLAFPSLDGDVE